MAEKWTVRQRRTQEVMGVIADHVLEEGKLTAEQIYGLCQLTWITRDSEGEDAGYIASTKLPGLRHVFPQLDEHIGLAEAAEAIGRTIGVRGLRAKILRDTGFTNFYGAYRNSALPWIRKHIGIIEPLVRKARALENDDDAARLAARIDTLPAIPDPSKNRAMKPAFLLTPLLFSLDRRERFPIINGREGVKALLARHRAGSSSLEEQFRVMISQYGHNGIRNAADLDQADLVKVVIGKNAALKKDNQANPKAAGTVLTTKLVDGAELPLKDEEDVERVSRAGDAKARQQHNRMTNQLKQLWDPHFELREGTSKDAKYDVLVKACLGEGDLLIEVKSSDHEAEVRMAMGQLYAYSFRFRDGQRPRLAVLLPRRPSDDALALLHWRKIGCLWFSNKDQLETGTSWLTAVIKKGNSK